MILRDTRALGKLGESLPSVHITVVLSMSADGKIADSDRTPARFSSPQDLAHLETEIAKVDAVLFGAGTLRAYGSCLPVRQPTLIARRQAHQQPDQPIQIVCSRSGQIDANLRFFQQSVPRWLLTTEQAAEPWQLRDGFERILYLPPDPPDWAMVMLQLSELGIERLALLGGGALVAGFVQQDLVDELYLTICPILIGGQAAPTPVDGCGLSASLAPRLQLLGVRTIENEVFLHYRRCHPKED